MLDKEGAEAAADIGFIGDEEAVAASIARLADAGATDFVAAIVGDAEERRRGFALDQRARPGLSSAPSAGRRSALRAASCT